MLDQTVLEAATRPEYVLWFLTVHTPICNLTTQTLCLLFHSPPVSSLNPHPSPRPYPQPSPITSPVRHPHVIPRHLSLLTFFIPSLCVNFYSIPLPFRVSSSYNNPPPPLFPFHHLPLLFTSPPPLAPLSLSITSLHIFSVLYLLPLFSCPLLIFPHSISITSLPYFSINFVSPLLYIPTPLRVRMRVFVCY